ncbi:MAG: FAD-binding oxidoreductase [Rhodoblastus sp.]|nr:MAG: FAD-binding oxidoreductase [Rhodoblastus sp.]
MDFIVIGAGVSGAAAAWALAEHGATLLLEAEDRPGHHATGRSAALYTPNFGPPLVRAINADGRAFFEAPPPDFADAPLLAPRGGLTIARPGEESALDAVLDAATPRDPIFRMTRAEATARAPTIRAELIAAACYEPGVADMDVAAIHQGFLRGLRRRGGTLICRAPATSFARVSGLWTVHAGGERYRAPIVVNAAGAWGDVVGALAGATPLGLTAKRRTAVIVAAPQGLAPHDMPLVEFAGSAPYLKPDGGRVMASLGDETIVAPQDAQPDDLDVALLVDWLERHTHLTVRTAPRAWAGLRSFTPDGAPVAGFDPRLEGFFHLVGQGGYGVMMAPTLARLAADLILRGGSSHGIDWPGFDIDALSARDRAAAP